jgi:hypothetical protein
MSENNAESSNKPSVSEVYMSCLVLDGVVSAEWLYEALRPGKSWKHNADQLFWSGEARRLTFAIKEKLEKENRENRENTTRSEAE